MYMAATPIWEAWSSGGPFIGENRANGRITVDPNWNLEFNETVHHRGRGTWWRDEPDTFSDFARESSWMIDSRNRAGARSFQQVRNGEWTYWGGGGESEPIPPPSGTMTRAEMAYYLKGVADTKASEGEATPLPPYDGTVDYPDLGSVSAAVREAIGQLSQAGIILGYPDGNYRPNGEVTHSQKIAYTSRLEDYLWGGTSAGGAAVEVPSVETISWDRSIDTDAAECTIVIDNIQMKTNTGYQADTTELGLPGYYTPTRGDNPDSIARWPNHSDNPWAGIIVPNAIVRTYEGYGGQDLTIRQAVAAGQLRQTGTWLIDRVNVGSDGKITIEARDMARLLIEQFILPPIVPESVYPLRYCRYITTETTELRSGNYFDYSDIIYDLLIWSGFYYDSFPRETLPDLGGGPPPEPSEAGFAQVHGVIETTGAYADDCLPDDLFDKRPIIDSITELRNIVGYLFWINEEGGAHFQSPNWFQPGNFDENLTHLDYIPEIDENVNATGYSATLSSENIRTKIIISSEAIPPVPPFGSSAKTYEAYKDAISRATFYTPTQGQEMWHGMHLPAMWVNGAFNNQEEQQIMAELIAMHIYYRGRQSSVTMIGNPCIQVNDQVRIYERTSSESHVHYVRGVSSSMNNSTGQYNMTLTTHWLGDGNDWVGDRFSGERVMARFY